MKETTKPTIAYTLETLRQQIQRWREDTGKSHAMPEELWRAAAELAEKSSINPIAHELGLNYSALKKRVVQAQKRSLPVARPVVEFLELVTGDLPGAGGSEIEMETAGGSQLRIKLRHCPGIDLIEVVREFLKATP